MFQIQNYRNNFCTLRSLYCTDVTVEFDPVSYNVEEGGVVNFRVVLRGMATIPVSVVFATRDGTARGEHDVVW